MIKQLNKHLNAHSSKQAITYVIIDAYAGSVKVSKIL